MKLNTRNKGRGLDLLCNFDNHRVVDAVVFDPQYRAGLDKLGYGNEGERQIRRAALPQMSRLDILNMGEWIALLVKPSGYIFLWLDKFELCNFNMASIFGEDSTSVAGNAATHALQIVDLITWDKLRIGMGYRTRRRGEYCMVLQKLPILAKATWTDHGIPDVWPEKADTKLHPHRKPLELTKRLLGATVMPGGLVVNPCAGSFMVLDACKALGIDFLGCDILGVPKCP